MNGNSLKVVYICSDARKDKNFLETLGKFLVNRRRANQIVEWHTGLLQAGLERDVHIAQHLNEADILILLVSVDFLNSSSAYDREMKIAMERHNAGKARVIPILLRECETSDTPFARLSPLPEGGKPVDQHKNKDAVFTAIAKAIGNVIQELIKSRPSRTSLPPRKPLFSKEVLHLCDRHPQQAKVELALEKRDLSRRPLVCVIHGTSEECLAEFKERLRKDSLPKFLESDLAFEEYPVVLPEAEDYFPSIYQKNLAGNFTNRSASLDEVANIISKNPARILVYSRLYSNQWDSQGMKQTDEFLSFWNDFPDLIPGNRLVSCLLITHKTDSPAHINNTQKAREFLKSLETPLNLMSYQNLEGKTLSNLSAVVLPELASVVERDVVDWIEGRHFRKLCEQHDPFFCDLDGPVYEEIEELYSGMPQPGIPMRRLVTQLEQIVSKHICKG
ncbi:MAG TPA: TIR domain-containing protein [Pyrinomonadaceae bacterium]